ncbi:MAG: DUF2125 domain-containing protein [Beijerinckiaceae bacterium]|nr:DUF2125 domain-containing protein [Beijerinckiaceae bacterium]
MRIPALVRIPSLILIVLLVTAGVLGGFWVYATRTASQALDSWLAAEQTQGRHWTCPGRAITGFPFAIDMTCDHPTFAGRLRGDQAEISLQGLEIRATLLDPFHAAFTLAPPFTYRAGDRQTASTVAWTSLHGTLGGLPRRVSTLTLSGTGLAAIGNFSPQETQTGQAARGDATLHLTQDGEAKVEFKIALTGAKTPILDDALGTIATDTDLAFSGRITKPVFAIALAPADVMELWRQAGGDITFWQMRLVRGESSIEAAGPLHLDAMHRIAGRLDASFTGLAPLLRRYGVNPNIAKASGLLNRLFDTHPRAPTTDNGELRLPVDFKDGKVGIGPFQTNIALPPLY